MFVIQVAKREGRLTGAEVRFLRKAGLGLSQIDFARTVGVDPATVSRWENDKEPVGTPADRAIRLMAAHGHPAQAYPLEQLANMSRPDAPERDFELTMGRDGWRAHVAAAWGAIGRT